MKTLFGTLLLLLNTIFLLAQEPGSGYALDFDGTDDFVRVASPYRAYTNELTVECWVNTDVIQLADGLLSQSTEAVNAAGTNVWLLGNSGSGNSFTFYVWDNGTVRSIGATSNLSNTGWHHVAGVISASEISIYVDGIKEATSGTGISTGINSNASAVMHIGHDSRYVNSVRMLDAKIDEVRIWKKALTESEIRSWMCRKVNSSHSQFSNMVGYYKFDENAGTTAYDSLNTNNGILTNGPTHVLSGAAIGDESTSSYGSGNSTSVTETHSDGSSFKIDNFTGTPDGAHVYLVNEAPNSTTESLSGALESTRYYGTFVVGGTSPTHTATYDYTGNTNITGGTETQAVLTSRAENATTSWTKLTNSFDLNTSTDVISECNVSTNQEYAAGFDAVLQERPGSGYAAVFDGSDDYVTIPNSNALNLGNNLTLSLWFYSAASVPNGSGQDLMGKNYHFNAPYVSYGLAINNNIPLLMLGATDNTFNSFAATTTISQGTWYHLAATYDGATAKVYLNGVLESSTSFSKTLTYNTDVLTLGGWVYNLTANNQNFYNGHLDEVRVWNTALSQSNIQDWMSKKVNSTHPNYCNLVSYYRCDENTGTALIDYAGSNNGTLTNGPTYALSGAAIGDESTNSYGSGNSTSVTETHADGSSFKVDNFTGTPDGVHVYLVNEAPNSTTESLSGALESTRYYGTFVVGGTSPTHSVTYDYTGNTNITGGTESETKLTTRADNSGTSWTAYSSYFDLDDASNTISKCGQTANKEYAAGFDNTSLQERPGSGYALTFDGSNDYVDGGNTTASALDDFTAECWMYFDGGSNQWFTSFVASTDHKERIQVEVYLGKIYFGWESHSNGLTSFSSMNGGTIANNTWYHVAVTNSSTTGKQIYVNGKLEASNANTLSPTELSGTANLYLGRLYHASNNYYFDGRLDEVRVWNKVLTQSEIRDWMTKKVTSSHPQYCSLQSYFRFDENTGSIAYNYAGGTNGTISGATYGLSEVPVGDESTNSYGSGNSTTVTETHSDGSSFKIDNFTGAPDGAHVYLVNEAPNSTTESLSGSLESTRYYGTFVVGGTSPTHSVTYDYTGNTNITGGTESEVKLVSRADNSGASWSTYSAYFDVDEASNTISKCGQSANKEYAAGFDNTTLQERPGSGYALTYDGTNDYVVTSDIPELANASAVTYEAWIYIPGSSWDDYATILSKEAGSGNRVQLVLSGGSQGGTNDIIAVVGDVSNNMNLNTNSDVIPYNTWTHVAMVFDGSLTGDANRLKIYVNGIQQTGLATAGSGSVPATTPNTTADFYIGSRGTSLYYPGSLDEVRVWNKALSETELRNNMCKKITSADANYCNLAAYYRFDENTGSTLYDYAGGINGTLTNGPVYALSGVPVGDNATFAASVTSSTTLSLAHADGPQMNVDVTSGTADLIAIYRIDEAPNVTTAPSGLTEVSHSHYYGVKAFGSSSLVYEVEYNYNGHDRLTDSEEDSLKLCSRANNSSSSWTLENATLNTTSNTLTLGGQTGTQFIMGSANQFPLPVDLVFFTANLQDDVVELNWATASELNSDYFLVQKSLDGKSWKNIERVGAQGNSNQEVHYGISDFELVPNKIYYRLVQVDLDGKSHHYPIQSIWNDGKSDNNVSRVYPNPTKGILILSSNDIDLSYAKIINSMGNQWSAIDLVSDKGDNQVTFDISSFPQGQYVLLVGGNSYRFVKE